MFKQILITLDGSPRAESVLQPALDVARAMRSGVTLLRIVDATGKESERGSVRAGSSDAAMRSLAARQAQNYLERIARESLGDDLVVQIVVKEGVPAKQILDAAEEARADLIAMATRARTGLKKLMLGSVAEAVMHETSLPLLLVRCAS